MYSNSTLYESVNQNSYENMRTICICLFGNFARIGSTCQKNLQNNIYDSDSDSGE